MIRLLILFVSLLGFAHTALADVRVVSQTVGTDELLLALAEPSQIAALSHLATNADYSVVAKEAAAYPKIGSGDAEQILKFKPTLVLAADYSRAELIEQVKRTGVRVVIFDHYATLADAFENLRKLAKELGPDAEKRAEVLIARDTARVAELTKKLSGVKPVRVIAPSVYGVIPGTDTTFQDFCDHAGAINLGATLGKLKGHAPAPTELMLAWPVDVVVLAGDDVASVLAPLKKLPPYQFMSAVKNDRAVVMNTALFSCVSHRRVDGYEQLARVLHPEVFK